MPSLKRWSRTKTTSRPLRSALNAEKAEPVGESSSMFDFSRMRVIHHAARRLVGSFTKMVAGTCLAAAHRARSQAPPWPARHSPPCWTISMPSS